jgi:prephenate dehydrogenase
MKKVKIIGMGRFGTLLFKIIKKHFPKVVFVEKVEEADVVCPCVPIRAFEEVIRDIAPRLKQNAVVIDVCSVKMHPVKIMKKHLRQDTQIIATHPLFGPDSTKSGLKDLPLVAWPVRISKAKFGKFIKLAKSLGLDVHVMSPKEHDKFMAYSQSYTHLVGRIGKELNLRPTPIDTAGFTQTLKIQQYVVNDSEELFVDMHKFNPYAKRMRDKFIKAAQKLDNEINLS